MQTGTQAVRNKSILYDACVLHFHLPVVSLITVHVLPTFNNLNVHVNVHVHVQSCIYT